MVVYAGSVYLFHWTEKTAYIICATVTGLTLLGWFVPKKPPKPRAAA